MSVANGREIGQDGSVRFVLIRHGQSINNLLWAETGDSIGRHHDPVLTPLGHQQAHLLGEVLADGVLPWRITQLHSSLMTRAVQTAAPLADALDLPLIGHPEAYETGGLFMEEAAGVRIPHPGATATELRLLSGRLMLPNSAGDDGWFPGPYEDGEELIMDRAQRVIADLRARHSDDDVVALVMHGAFFQFLFRALLGIDTMSGWNTKHNTALTLIGETAGGITIAERIDWTPHLSEELLTL